MELHIDRLTKQYGSKLAVDCFSATLKSGIYGLLGANGAGKTTLMRLICDIQTSTSGEIFYDNQLIGQMGEEYRNLLGYLPQDFGYYPEFSAYKFLLYMSSLKGLNKEYAKARALELLDIVSLMPEKDKRIRTFSGGMKQRLGIAQAMLNNPKILILDEPTAGLDPKERVHFRNLISSFSKDKIVLLSTHIVSDIEYIAGDLLLMKKGKLCKRGAPNLITSELKGCVWECEVATEAAQVLTEQYNVGNLKNVGAKTILRIIDKEKPMKQALPVTPTLEDLYLYYFNEGSDIK